MNCLFSCIHWNSNKIKPEESWSYHGNCGKKNLKF